MGFQAAIGNFLICICISNSLHKENREQRRRESMEANIRQTIAYMQMLANFCQHLPIYNQANWKPIHPLASLLPKTVVVLKENVQKRLNFRPSRLPLTQNLLHKRRMHKYNQWFCRKTWDMQSPGYRGWKTRCPGREREKGMVASNPSAQLSEDWNVASWLQGHVFA